MKAPASKKCAKCLRVRGLSEFHRQPSGPLGRHSYCKPCANAVQRESRVRNITPQVKRRYQLMTRYRMTPLDFDDMLRRQGGVCALCREVPKRACLDHDHKTGHARGILCHRCNIGLPYVEDVLFRERALVYLAGPLVLLKGGA